MKKIIAIANREGTIKRLVDGKYGAKMLKWLRWFKGLYTGPACLLPEMVKRPDIRNPNVGLSFEGVGSKAISAKVDKNGHVTVYREAIFKNGVWIQEKAAGLNFIEALQEDLGPTDKTFTTTPINDELRSQLDEQLKRLYTQEAIGENQTVFFGSGPVKNVTVMLRVVVPLDRDLEDNRPPKYIEESLPAQILFKVTFETAKFNGNFLPGGATHIHVKGKVAAVEAFYLQEAEAGGYTLHAATGITLPEGSLLGGHLVADGDLRYCREFPQLTTTIDIPSIEWQYRKVDFNNIDFDAHELPENYEHVV